MRRLLWIGSPFFGHALSAQGWRVFLHNFETPSVYGWRDLVRLAGFEPDVLVVADKSRAPFVLGMENFPCLTVWYSVDAHIHSWQPFYAQAFDLCLVSLRDRMGDFAGPFLSPERVWWSPPFAANEDVPLVGQSREWDCLFVGSVNANLPRRAAFLEALGSRLPGLRLEQGDYRQLFSRGRVLLNHCEHGDLNFRVFEAMGCGGCLVTPRVGHGLDALFTEGEHFLGYTPDSVEEALARIRFFLENPAHAERMRRAALAAIDAGHRAEHRARTFTQRIRALGERAGLLVRQRLARARMVREKSLRLLYLHWAEENPDAALRAAWAAAAGGTFG
ncbi:MULTISPECIES: glycosyltransferase [unclassified Desulfovibrio]|uniref:glycosyltransferase family protein n=1 Tax=unclassified Desulfovibrio TaxID=2593640 RepID=UPI000F5D713F|nr:MULTISPECIES: glycosyltransferase [unclassified Desulfovibrio]RRD69533.1 glycosyltransferase family 1 protein [Desulfovibrio sp. OH1209_COT-279]RRD86207.1 glycosyltransferase family 1 protein [Desulfovibrio sp. OH1186_COT-070]